MQMTSEEKTTNSCFVYVPEVVDTVHVFVNKFLENFRTNTENVPTERNNFCREGGGCDFMFTFIINDFFNISDRFKELFDYYNLYCYKDHIKFVSFLTFQYTMILLSILNSYL